MTAMAVRGEEEEPKKNGSESELALHPPSGEWPERSISLPSCCPPLFASRTHLQS